MSISNMALVSMILTVDHRSNAVKLEALDWQGWLL